MTTATSSVVVVSYRPGDWLRPCLDSVVGQAGEVIVVDNGSADGRAATIAEEAGARAVHSPHNMGFAAGAALGLGLAAGELVAVLNDDAVAGPGWLSSAERILADPAVAAVTPKVVLHQPYLEVTLEDDEWFAPGDHRPLGRQVTSLELDGVDVLAAAVGAGLHELETGPGGRRWRWGSGRRPFYVPAGPAGPAPATVTVNDEPVPAGPAVRLLNHAGSYLRAHGIAAEYGLGAPDDGRFDERREPFGFSGTAPVFRADALARVGTFAPAFFAYNEDTDWCLRARLCGLRIEYDPSVIVEHRLSATSGGTASEMVRQLSQRNALLCLARTAPLSRARPELAQRMRMLPGDPVARRTLRKLPWALTSRLVMSRKWTVDPADLWDHWAERDSTWDVSPARV